MSRELDSYPGLKSLVEATELSNKTILHASLLQAFLDQLGARKVSISRLGRLELSELIGKTVTFNPGLFRPSIWPTGLRFELVREFERLGSSSSDAWDAADLFLEMAKKGGL